jgi:AcrR family transcriptional regulator
VFTVLRKKEVNFPSQNPFSVINGNDLIMRVTKDPKVRRQELIDIAEKLFVERGYENVAVSDIVKAAHVAQGTFYWYFKSKEAIFAAITDRAIEFLIKRIWDIANDKTLSGVQKLVSIFCNQIFDGQTKGLAGAFYDPAYAKLHTGWERLPEAINAPITQIIKQGIAEGTFNTSYPEEAASAYVGIFALLMQDAKKFDPKSEVMARKFAALFDFIEKILCASQGCVLGAFLERNVPPV